MAKQKQKKQGGDSGGRKASELRRGLSSREAMRRQQRQWLETLKPFTDAYDEVLAHLDWLATAPGLASEIGHLLSETRRNVVEGVDQILSVDDPHEVEATRMLLELQYLYQEFAASPNELSRWNEADTHRRHQLFNFGKLREHEEARQGIKRGMVSASRDHYSVHSGPSHPRPSREIEPASLDRRAGFLNDLGDHFFHSCDAVSAADKCVSRFADSYSPGREALPRSATLVVQQRLYALFIAPIPLHAREDLLQPRPIKQTRKKWWQTLDDTRQEHQSIKSTPT